MKIDNSEIKRFYKQIILKKIGLKGQEKILNSKILIVGMGGLGCPLLIYLVNSGIKEIAIVDDDKIEISNLNRQILFNYSDIGKLKVEVAKKYIKRVNNKVKIKTFNKKINNKNINSIFKNYNIICDGTDNFKSRFLINDYCLKKKKILVSAAISKFDGHLLKFNFKDKVPCLRCFITEDPGVENNCETEGIISPVAGVMGTLQANEVIKTILGLKDELKGKILIFDGLKSEFRKISFERNPNCVNKC